MKLIFLGALTCALIGCGESDQPELNDNTDNGASSGGNGSNSSPEQLECRKENLGRKYVSFDGSSLTGMRQGKALGVDRQRVKPFPVLYREMERVLGKMPQPVADAFFAAAASFELPPQRWFEEPKVNGVGLSTYYDVAFSAALAHIEATPAPYASLPTTDSSKRVCETMAHSAWRRRPAQSEVDRCVDLAVNKLAKEANPKRRWAYTIASVLSTADFLSY